MELAMVWCRDCERPATINIEGEGYCVKHAKPRLTLVPTTEQGACESGWTGDRCTYALGHDGPHSNA